MERHVARLIPLTDDQRAAHEAVRDAIWNYYQRLKAYRESPTPQRRGRLEKDFDRLFLKKTGWSELDEELQKIHGKKSELLLVLERPEIPLHNNLSENDIRQYVKPVWRVDRRRPWGTCRRAGGRRSWQRRCDRSSPCRRGWLSC